MNDDQTMVLGFSALKYQSAFAFHITVTPLGFLMAFQTKYGI